MRSTTDTDSSSAGLVQQQRVGQSPDREVHVVAEHPLAERRGSAADDVESGETREVTHPDPVPDREVLDALDGRPLVVASRPVGNVVLLE